jgi:N-methylhydantoinase A
VAGGIVAGIDVGGTFTDLVVFDPVAGSVRLAKNPTTPENQAFGVLAALDAAGVPLSEIDLIVHGTTTTTNAVLEPHYGNSRSLAVVAQTHNG